jgi:hypothetical protein
MADLAAADHDRVGAGDLRRSFRRAEVPFQTRGAVQHIRLAVMAKAKAGKPRVQFLDRQTDLGQAFMRPIVIDEADVFGEDPVDRLGAALASCSSNTSSRTARDRAAMSSWGMEAPGSGPRAISGARLRQGFGGQPSRSRLACQPKRRKARRLERVKGIEPSS